MKKKTAILLFVLTFFLLPGAAFAQVFQLNTIGTVNVAGTSFSQFWYTGTNVSLTGNTSAGSSVSVSVDSSVNSATVDESGNWSYATTLTEGDHQVSLTSAGETINFTLTIGSTQPSTTTTGTATTPVSGASLPMFFLALLGIGICTPAVIYLKKAV